MAVDGKRKSMQTKAEMVRPEIGHSKKPDDNCSTWQKSEHVNWHTTKCRDGKVRM